jgi:hypothetical protein
MPVLKECQVNDIHGQGSKPAAIRDPIGPQKLHLEQVLVHIFQRCGLVVVFGLANFDGSMDWFVCTVLSSVTERPSVHVTIQ